MVESRVAMAHRDVPVQGIARLQAADASLKDKTAPSV